MPLAQDPVPGAVICTIRSRGKGIGGIPNELLQGLFTDCRHPRQSHENRHSFHAAGLVFPLPWWERAYPEPVEGVG